MAETESESAEQYAERLEEILTSWLNSDGAPSVSGEDNPFRHAPCLDAIIPLALEVHKAIVAGLGKLSILPSIKFEVLGDDPQIDGRKVSLTIRTQLDGLEDLNRYLPMVTISKAYQTYPTKKHQHAPEREQREVSVMRQNDHLDIIGFVLHLSDRGFIDRAYKFEKGSYVETSLETLRVRPETL